MRRIQRHIGNVVLPPLGPFLYVGQDARIKLRMILRRGLCAGSRLKLQVRVAGGIHCDDGLPCVLIGYFFRATADAPPC